MSIELRPDTTARATPGDLDEVVAQNASVHLEVLGDNVIMLIIEDEERHVHLCITYRGGGPMRVWEYESFPVAKKNFRFCDGCGNPFPRSGRAIYCQDCRNKGVPARDRRRRFREKHPGYDREYRARPSRRPETESKSP